ncbi:non-ribosomal peptide synthetase, partial [Streptomyces sp. MCAF7]
ELGVPVSAVLLAAHAKVLSALSGEQEVVTGYAADTTDPPLACRLTVASESWRTLVLSAHRATAEPEVADHEAGYEVEFDPAGTERGLGDGVVLGVGWCRCDRGGRLVARLRYRTEVIDGECAARIGGYHLAALGLMAADAEAEHAQQSLLSAQEVRHQLEGLAGPRRMLPQGRAHELFEQRARAHPEAVAAVHGDRRWTYGELNARANRLA